MPGFWIQDPSLHIASFDTEDLPYDAIDKSTDLHCKLATGIRGGLLLSTSKTKGRCASMTNEGA